MPVAHEVDTGEAENDLRTFGVQDEQIGGYLHADGDEDEAEEGTAPYEVRPENWDSVQVFLSLTSRWQIDGMSGRRSGFLRQDIESTLRLMQIKRPRHRQIFEDIRVMEHAALEMMNRER